VLTLLRREFPDVTISKIRFLESQGLVNPERTPSGYRKFYEEDVERLEWVLRQQREHFLPLKVIKGRLEDETSAGEGNGEEAPRGKDRGRGRVASSRSTGVAKDGGPRVAAARGRAGVIEDPGETEGVSPRRPSAQKRAARRRRGDPSASAGGDGAQDGGAEARDGESARQALPGFPRRDASARAAHDVRSGGGSAEGDETAAEDKPGGDLPVEGFVGTGFTLEELAAGSGLEVADVRQLESYGLLGCRSIGGVEYFNDQALKVACLAKAFAGYGVEARHLRLHLLSAQREAGFIEQVVLPLLKQRNPASKQRAHEAIAELSRLGQELHAVLLQKQLHELLD
jgi:DNA-binding transcriptional MerR regulator